MLTLNTIKAHPGATKKRKRLGRGSGSGHGPTAGKGDKGQLQRSGGHARSGFEGGQTPMYRRIPKQGFKNPCAREWAVVNLVDLDRVSKVGLKDINLITLSDCGLVKGRYDRLVVLAKGEITSALKIKAHKVSASALEKIQKAGGTVELIPLPKVVGKKKKKVA
jgi:large subunit ribosomal protein L15